MSPRVSLIIATYNYAHYVTEALDSLLDQTFEDFEAIVIDDASTDNTREVLARYAHDPRVRLVFNDANEGNIGTRNHGFARAPRGGAG